MFEKIEKFKWVDTDPKRMGRIWTKQYFNRS